MYKIHDFFSNFELCNYSFTLLKCIQLSPLEINTLKSEQENPGVIRNKMIHRRVHRPPIWSSRMQNTPSFLYSLIPILTSFLHLYLVLPSRPFPSPVLPIITMRFSYLHTTSLAKRNVNKKEDITTAEDQCFSREKNNSRPSRPYYQTRGSL